MRLTRRTFLQISALAGGGVSLSLFHVSSALSQGPVAGQGRGSGPAPAPRPQLSPLAFVNIATDGNITIKARGVEIGQGVKTSLPMMVAEELDADWSKVRIEQADLNESIYGPQGSGGSTSTPNSYMQLRRVGAAGRQMLIAAAAKRWGVSEAECITDSGCVLHAATKKSLGYGELAADVASLTAPDLESVKLKDPKTFRIMGKPHPNVDNHAITTGKPLFGIDVKLPGMLHAILVKCPVYGGRVEDLNIADIRKMPGVRHVFVLDTVPANGEKATISKVEPRALVLGSGIEPAVAIVADTWWQAQVARRSLKVDWDFGAGAAQSSEKFDARARELLASPPAETLRSYGDAEGALKAAAKVVEAEYAYPFLGHGAMEPLGGTASYNDGKLEMWTTTQQPDAGRMQVARALNIQPGDIKIHISRIGGGFGRRLSNDYVMESAWIAKAVGGGVPVKLLWSREDDFTHDQFRPGGYFSFKGGLDEHGKLVAWRQHFATFGDGRRATGSGSFDPLEYPSGRIRNFASYQSMQPLVLRTGALRAPGANAYAFVLKAFIDELAVAAGRDPIDFHLDLLSQAPEPIPPAMANKRDGGDGMNAERLKGVIKLVAEKSGWANRKSTAGKGMGFACHYCHQGYFAEVAEVTVDSRNRITVNRVWAAGDVGNQIVNPLGAEAQVQGSVLEGMAHMNQEITLADGRVQQSNYPQHPPMRFRQAPAIEIFWNLSEFPPTGLGEPALPPVLPAIANAVFAATGKRIRTLPVARSGFSFA